ncbi:MAG: lysophospholipid acyltransferase family protein [Planctomycetota bacterium]|jgi:1-acyl-sn-glycerol-3-phosphate acyltransferase
MPNLSLIITVLLVWIGLMAIVHWVVIPLLCRGPGRTPMRGLVWYSVRVFARIVHRVRFVGREILPPDDDHGGLIVVINHTGAVDPVLVQAGCRFEIRWMMAQDMMGPALDWFWRWKDLIPVDRHARDHRSLREAIRHVKAGGALGIFPEGRIVTPPGQLWPFNPGVGLIVAKTKAPVVLVWVSGTPDTTEMTRSILTPSHARVEFLERIEFGDERDAAKITEILRERIADASGWPLNDEPPPPEVVLQGT